MREAQPHLAILERFYSEDRGYIAERIRYQIDRLALAAEGLTSIEIRRLLHDFEATQVSDSASMPQRSKLELARLLLRHGILDAAEKYARQPAGDQQKGASRTLAIEAQGLLAQIAVGRKDYVNAQQLAAEALASAYELANSANTDRVTPAFLATLNGAVIAQVSALLNGDAEHQPKQVFEALRVVTNYRHLASARPVITNPDTAPPSEHNEIKRGIAGLSPKPAQAAERRLQNMGLARLFDRERATQLQLKSPRLASVALKNDWFEAPAQNEAQLTYLFGENGGWLFLRTAKFIRATQLPAESELAADASAARSVLTNAGNTDLQPLVRLGKKLIPPLPGNINTLKIVADSILHHLPFAVLGQPTQSEYRPIVADYLVSYVQRLSPTTPTTSQGGDVVVFANADYSAGSARQDNAGGWLSGLSDLAHSRLEADAVARLMSDSHTVHDYRRMQATVGNLRAVLDQPVSILHLATHGYFRSDFSEVSGLAFAQFPGESVDKALLTTSDVYRFAHAPALVVLSGCETSLGSHFRGIGMTGMVSAFLNKGTRDAVGTLWKVSDRHSSVLMEYFYRALSQRGIQNTATALALAQRSKAGFSASTEQQETARYAHPYFWGAYVHYQ